MNISEINLLNFFIIILLMYFVLGFENTFKSIITSEFIWISLFINYLIYAIIYDNITILSLTLFFLIFSAIEISICLVLIVFQKKFFKTLSSSTQNSSNEFNLKSKKIKIFKFKL